MTDGKDTDAFVDRILALDKDETAFCKDTFTRNGVMEVESDGAIDIFKLVSAVRRGAEHAKEQEAMSLPAKKILRRGESHEAVCGVVAR